MPPQMVSIGGGGADPRLGMEYMETEELGDGISINRHRYNTEFGHNTCDFVSMEDQSPESVAKLSEALKRQQEDKETAKWDARDAAAKTRKDEVMWSYEVEDCGAAECNGLYERSDDYGWRNEAPVYVKAKGSPKGCDKVFSLSREEQPVNEARTEFKMGWILGCIDEKKAYFGTLTDGLSIPHEQWQALADDVKSPVPYCRWKSCTDRANDHKVMGNVYFKRGQYHEAIAEYSEGLLYDPVDAATLATLLSNRSECRMRLKDWLEALGDAEDALDALGDDPALTATTAPIVEKAHNRRGKAARELGQLAIAADAYVAALEASAALRKLSLIHI